MNNYSLEPVFLINKHKFLLFLLLPIPVENITLITQWYKQNLILPGELVAKSKGWCSFKNKTKSKTCFSSFHFWILCPILKKV